MAEKKFEVDINLGGNTITNCPRLDAIESNIAQEITDREAADVVLQNAIDQEVSDRQTADNALQIAIDTHISNTGNPHQTTLEQARSADNFFEGEVDMNSNRLRNLPAPTNADEAVNKAYVDGLVDTTIKQPDAFTPAGSYPTTYFGVAIKKGDSFRMSSAGTVGTKTVESEDLLIALANTPGQTESNWQIIDSNKDQASESVKGVAKIASQSDAQDEFTSNNTDILTPQKGWYMLLRFVQLAWTWTLKQTFTAAPRFNSASASQYLKTDGSKDLTSVSAIPATDITADSTHRFVTDTEKSLWNSLVKRSIEFTFDGQGGVIANNSVSTSEVHFTGTITGWEVLEVSSTPVSGSVTIDVWKDTYANYPPTVLDTIWGTKPSLSGAIKNSATGLNIAVTQGDILKANIDSATSVIKVKLKLYITQTA